MSKIYTNRGKEDTSQTKSRDMLFWMNEWINELIKMKSEFEKCAVFFKEKKKEEERIGMNKTHF